MTGLLVVQRGRQSLRRGQATVEFRQFVVDVDANGLEGSGRRIDALMPVARREGAADDIQVVCKECSSPLPCANTWVVGTRTRFKCQTSVSSPHSGETKVQSLRGVLRVSAEASFGQYPFSSPTKTLKEIPVEHIDEARLESDLAYRFQYVSSLRLPA